MLKSVYDMALKESLAPTPGFRQKPVKAHIMLDNMGIYRMIAISEEPVMTLCPDKSFPGHTGNSSANFIVDYAATVLYSDELGLSEEKAKKYRSKHLNYTGQMKEADSISCISPVNRFLVDYDNDSNLRARVTSELKESKLNLYNDLISFRIDTENVEKSDEWVMLYKDKVLSDNEAGDTVISSITGKIVPAVNGRYPQLKRGIFGTGVPLYSDTIRDTPDPLASTKSYSMDAPVMGQGEADTIVRGMEYISNDLGQYDRELGIMWWYDRTEKKDIIRDVSVKPVSRWAKKRKETDEEKRKRQLEENRRKSREYKELLDAAVSGKRPEYISADSRYHIVSLVFPEQGRMTSEWESEGSYAKLYDNISQWYRDSDIICEYYDTENSWFVQYDKVIKNIYEILYLLGLVSDKEHDRTSSFRKLKKDLLMAVYDGRQLSEKLVREVSEKYTKYVSGLDDSLKFRTPCILSIEKIYLLRKGGYDMDKQLTPGNTSIGYQCGRWFACVDYLQKETLKALDRKVNIPMVPKIYKCAKRTPAKAVSLLKGYVQLYEERLNRKKPGYGIKYDRLFAEIAGNIGEYFPEKLNISEQAAFDLGYAQQKQDFYTRNRNNADIDSEERRK